MEKTRFSKKIKKENVILLTFILFNDKILNGEKFIFSIAVINYALKSKTEARVRRYFPDIFGNEFHKNRIASAILEQRLPHALLLDGPEGSGKESLAKEIAAALNCENSNDITHALPCGRCNTCRRIREGSYTDVKILRKASDKATLGVREIKEFRADMYLSASESRYKVYIIDEAEKMTTEAQNALLIILEEPPKNVIIMLLASGSDSILTTIKSRTQYIAMSRFDTALLSRYLVDNDAEARRLSMADPETFNALLVSADGRIGKAKELLNPKTRTENEEKRAEITALIEALGAHVPYTVLYEAIAGLPQKRPEFQESLEVFISALADLILSKKTTAFTPVFFTDTAVAARLAEEIPLQRLVKIYDLVAKTHSECTKNVNVTLAAANLAAGIKLT